jgi:hypothetical protein
MEKRKTKLPSPVIASFETSLANLSQEQAKLREEVARYQGNLPAVVENSVLAWWTRREPLLMEDVRALVKPQFPVTLAVVSILLGVVFTVAVEWGAKQYVFKHAPATATIRADCSDGNGSYWPKRADGQCYAADAQGLTWASPAKATDAGTVVTLPQIAGATPRQYHIIFRVTAPSCWVSANDQEGKIMRAGESGESQGFLKLRAGCPGGIDYWVDGERRYPENLSKTPAKSEVAVLP